MITTLHSSFDRLVHFCQDHPIYVAMIGAFSVFMQRIEILLGIQIVERSFLDVVMEIFKGVTIVGGACIVVLTVVLKVIELRDKLKKKKKK